MELGYGYETCTQMGTHVQVYIALLNTIGKALEAVIASRISYMVEVHSLLPHTHVGGRRGRSCEHAIHLLLE